MRYESTNSPIAQEAWPFAVPLAFAALLAYVVEMTGWAIALAVVLAYVLWFFRNPQRITPANEFLVVAPADGKIVAAGLVANSAFAGGQALRVGIFMNLFNCHINWAPYSGTVFAADYFPGRFLNAMEDKCGDENERKVIQMSDFSGRTILVKLVAGLIARRIVSPISVGDRLEKGEKIGLIRFGSRVEVWLPADSSLEVGIGQHVRGGETIIASLTVPERDANGSRMGEPA